jgi:protein-S-isoprenylcysteine O-methyltransferase Ste14
MRIATSSNSGGAHRAVSGCVKPVKLPQAKRPLGLTAAAAADAVVVVAAVFPFFLAVLHPAGELRRVGTWILGYLGTYLLGAAWETEGEKRKAGRCNLPPR